MIYLIFQKMQEEGKETEKFSYNHDFGLRILIRTALGNK